MGYQFVRLSSAQRQRFERLKSSAAMKSHGPLAFGEEVPLHHHAEAALYLVRDLADFLGVGICRILGADVNEDAVIVPAGAEHGWRALRDNVLIEHVFGSDNVQAVLA